MKALVLTLCATLMLATSFAQTKKIAHRSHSGADVSMFLLEAPDNLGIVEQFPQVIATSKPDTFVDTLLLTPPELQFEKVEEATPAESTQAPLLVPQESTPNKATAKPKRTKRAKRKKARKGSGTKDAQETSNAVLLRKPINKDEPQKRQSRAGLFWLLPAVLLPTLVFCKAVR